MSKDTKTNEIQSGNWHSVKANGNPSISDKYLTVCNLPLINIMFWNKGRWIDDGGEYVTSVKYWMPLPELPMIDSK